MLNKLNTLLIFSSNSCNMCSLQHKNRHTKTNESDRREVVKQEKQKKYGYYRSRMLMHLQNTGALTMQFYSDSDAWLLRQKLNAAQKQWPSKTVSELVAVIRRLPQWINLQRSECINYGIQGSNILLCYNVQNFLWKPKCMPNSKNLCLIQNLQMEVTKYYKRKVL